jgi:hypothetical protein
MAGQAAAAQPVVMLASPAAGKPAALLAALAQAARQNAAARRREAARAGWPGAAPRCVAALSGVRAASPAVLSRGPSQATRLAPHFRLRSGT